MEYSCIGRASHKISRLGFGCAPMSGYDYGKIDEADLTRAVRRALDLGINFFDTADIYGLGRAEELLSTALGRDRRRVFIATKFGLRRDSQNRIRKDCSAANVLQSVDESLRRLRIDTIALYQIHWPDPGTPIRETMQALLQCQTAGKIRHIGCSNFGIESIQEAEQWGTIDSTQHSYNLLDRSVEENILPFCRDHRIAFLAHSPLARGFLTGKYKIGHCFGESDTRNRSIFFAEENRRAKERLLERMKNIATQYNKSLTQVALRWILENPMVSCAIVGVKGVKQLEENAASVEWVIAPADRTRLSSRSTDPAEDNILERR